MPLSNLIFFSIMSLQRLDFLLTWHKETQNSTLQHMARKIKNGILFLLPRVVYYFFPSVARKHVRKIRAFSPLTRKNYFYCILIYISKKFENSSVMKSNLLYNQKTINFNLVENFRDNFISQRLLSNLII